VTFGHNNLTVIDLNGQRHLFSAVWSINKTRDYRDVESAIDLERLRVKSLLINPKEIIGALILGILSGFSTVLMTYYIGKSVDTMA
jgi:hypothetical protein